MKKAEEWLELLSDEARADVMKVKLAEEGNTERERIKQVEQTRRGERDTEGFWIIRGLAILAMVVATVATALTVNSHINSKQAVMQDSIHAAFPASFPPPPAAPKAEEKK